jgi:hypothetical protein
MRRNPEGGFVCGYGIETPKAGSMTCIEEGKRKYPWKRSAMHRALTCVLTDAVIGKWGNVGPVNVRGEWKGKALG